MSLFVGENSPSTDNSDIASEKGRDNQLSPSVVDTASPDSAQNPSFEPSLKVDGGLDIESGDDADNSSEEETTRPNRFAGPPQTWRGHTAADRQIAASLDQLQDSNLVAHLYNTHALKRRVLRPTEELAGLNNWQSRDAWLKTGKALQYTDALGLEQTELVPSKDWTAWPLDPANKFPFSQGPGVARESGASDEWDIGGGQAKDPGGELREEILAVFLRIAKDKWKARNAVVQQNLDRERTTVCQSRSPSKSIESVNSFRSTSQDSTGMKNGGDMEAEEEKDEDEDDEEDNENGEEEDDESGEEEDDEKEEEEDDESEEEEEEEDDDDESEEEEDDESDDEKDDEEGEEEQDHHAHVAENPGYRAPGKKRGRKKQIEVEAEPIFLADDAIAYRALQPLINSLLTKLDELAIAVQRTRLNHLGHGQFSGRSSQSDFTTATESTETESKPSSRPTSRGKRSESSQSRASSHTMSSRMGHTSVKNINGRSEHVEGVDHESTLNDTSDTSDASNTTMSRDSNTRKRARSASTTSTGSGSTTRDSTRAGLIDWSEVLGLAAVLGWNERALSRTAQRCATLFGEEMSFMPLDADAPIQSRPKPVRYTPSTVPSPQAPHVLGTAQKKRPFFQLGTIRCPHEGCYGHRKDFALPYRVVEHCRRVHGYDPRNNNEDNEARTVGGVHIDGFLQPVTVKQGWLGHGRPKAGQSSKKKLKVAEHENAEQGVAIESVEGQEAVTLK